MYDTNFQSILLQWYADNGRDLPWRRTKDPYAIWVSEIILQQTRISQGTDYWWRFMRAFPDVEALAAASEDEVLRLWQGLGYYSRARNLHFAANQIVEWGHFPNTYDEIKRLKGVGDYTAAAIASLAFNEPRAAVDGNVYRVLSRHYGINSPIDSTQGKHEFQAFAQDLLPVKQAGLWNQAMMDFGALQCTPQAPDCAACPLQETCYAYRHDKVDAFPVKASKLKIRERLLNYQYLRCGDEIAIHQRGAGDIWQGLWEPVLLPPGTKPSPKASTMIWKLTHQVIHASICLVEVAAKPQLPAGYKWVRESDLDQYALPRMIEKLIEAIR